VWCDNGLYPRKLYVNMVNGQPNWRCACFKELGWSDIRQVCIGLGLQQKTGCCGRLTDCLLACCKSIMSLSPYGWLTSNSPSNTIQHCCTCLVWLLPKHWQQRPNLRP
jgi:hypothetical protein